MPDYSTAVPPSGPSPCSTLLIGKGCGSEEMRAGIPFIGRAGREHRSYCDRHNLRAYTLRTTNLCRTYVPPDERLTPLQICEWAPDLLAEIHSTRPRLLVPIGADPVRLLLGNDADLKTVHGIPHKLLSLTNGAEPYPLTLDSFPDPGICVLPLIQPAAGFHSVDMRAWINWDYSQLARLHTLVQAGREWEIDYRHDPYAGKEKYYDVTGEELRRELLFWSEGIPPVIGIDTEGTPSDPFSLQICFDPPTAFMLRIDQPDYMLGVEALRECARRGSIFTGHNLGMYDLELLRVAFGLDLFHAQCHDTLYDAYLFCIEPLGLKPNSWRHLGMRMKSHTETVGALGVEYQIEYLRKVVEHTKGWGKPEPIWRLENSGEWKIKQKPQPLHRRVLNVLGDIETGRYSESGEDEGEAEDATSGLDSGEVEGELQGVNPRQRWGLIRCDLPELVARVEREIGPMPYGTMRRLWDKDREAALNYSCADSLGHRRLYDPFTARLEAEGKTQLAAEYSTNMHVFSAMQQNGMPARKSRLIALRDRMTDEMLKLVSEIAYLYNDGKPFNPKSTPQKRALLNKWGLVGLKETEGGQESTSKKAIEHYRFITDNMSEEEKFKRNLVVKLLRWGEYQHTRDMFCKPVLAQLPEDGPDEVIVRSQLLPWGTPTRRGAYRKPNLGAQPKHSELGKAIRDCYEAPEGYVFVEVDLASIQVAIMAHESGDPDLCQLIRSGVKFHRETASRYFEIPREQVTDVQYTFGKRIIFGTFFGQTGEGLREQLWTQGLTHFTTEMCQDGIDGVKYRVYPGIGRYEGYVEKKLRMTPDGSIRSMSGMERKLPGIHSQDAGVRNEALRQGVCQVIQGGERDVMNGGLTCLKDKVAEFTEAGIDVQWRLDLHDALLLTCPEWAADTVQATVEDGLTQHCGYKLRVPVRAESKRARTWGQL